MTEAALQIVPAHKSKNTRPMTAQAVRDAKEIQLLILRDIRLDNVKPSDRATLARSWCLVQDCIRVMRGIPDPGSLRPDLDPVQLARALKRSKTRTPIQIAGALAKFADDGDAGPDEPAPSKPKTAGAPETPKTETKAGSGTE